MRTDEGLLSFACIFIFKNIMTSLTFTAFSSIYISKYGINFLHQFINYHTQ